MTKQDDRHSFQTLDALRGAAALVVVAHHNNSMFSWRPHHGYLAVDLFFVLSGFVLSYAYQDRLDRGWPTIKFLKARVIRLAPLYLLALLFGFVLAALSGKYAALHLSWAEQLEYFGIGCFLLPIYSLKHPELPMFPYSGVSWTLFLEFLINVVHGFWLRRLSNRVLAGLILLSALLLSASVIHYKNENAGSDWASLLTGGVPRIAFSYLCGMMLFRLWRLRAEGQIARRVSPVFLIFLTGVTLVVPTPHEAITALAMTLIWLPLLVYLSALNEPGELTKVSFGLLGTASYAIYLFHVPFFLAVSMVWSGAKLHPAWAGYVIAFALVLMSLLVDKVYDTPVRSWLKS